MPTHYFFMKILNKIFIKICTVLTTGIANFYSFNSVFCVTMLNFDLRESFQGLHMFQVTSDQLQALPYTNRISKM